MTGALRRAIEARIALPLGCLLAVVAVGLTPGSGFETSRDFVFDLYQRLAPGPPPSGRVVVIDIDAESIRRLGQWPWPRDRLARLVDAAGGARAIGIDVLLSEPDGLSPSGWAAGRADLAPELRVALAALPDTDAQLAASIARAPVVLAAAATPPPGTESGTIEINSPVFESGAEARAQLPHYSAVTSPLPRLADAARGIGLVSALPEADGVLRRVPAVLAVGASLHPSFALEVLRVAERAERIGFAAGPLGGRRVTLGEHAFATDTEARVWLRYGVAASGRIRGGEALVSAFRVLDGAIDPGIFAGRIVLIGASAAGLGDIVVSPLRQHLGSAAVQRQLIENLLADDLLRRPEGALLLEVATALALGFVAAAWFARPRDRVHAVLFAAAGATLALGSFAAFRLFGLLLDWTMPVAALTATLLAALAVRMRDEMRARRLREGELAAALMQAEAADRTKTEFLANASHELRTPLTAVIGFSEIMSSEMMGPLSPVYSDYARSIHRSGTHLLAVIDDVLDLSVIDLGGMQPKDEAIAVERLLTDCGRMVAVRATDRAVTMRFDLPTRLPMLAADVRMVRQMVLNLLSNAIKYSPRKGEVTIAARHEADGGLAISVRDRGPGIAAADIPHALQRFGRLRSASMAQEPGIGIGLPLSKAMAELHGGRLTLESELGAGTEARLWFPPDRVQAIATTQEEANS